ncbi:alpha-hemoglobin-stabilizing protein [Ornithorhynchus anatinus]|uniref:Alpha hemoglobin stabilizing protein n=1 Tax=Ornithorhynchus anatinus TaxID=9258 RepID=A0A6I8NND2_ORNAN|nr:alpha-hemoglobin-stabilizing protein [Ornithorhynchus anatinus]
MAHLQLNRDLISSAMQEFHGLLKQQEFSSHIVIPLEAMETIVNDWVAFYISFYSPRLSGDAAEQSQAQEELQGELRTSAEPFLAKYSAFLNSLSAP